MSHQSSAVRSLSQKRSALHNRQNRNRPPSVAGLFILLSALTMVSGCQPATRTEPTNSTTAAQTAIPAAEKVTTTLPEVTLGDVDVSDAPADVFNPVNTSENLTPSITESTQSDETAETTESVEAPQEQTAPDTETATVEKSDADINASAVTNPNENATIVAGDWPQWGGTSYRNNTPIGKNIPASWNVGTFNRKTGEWSSEGAENIKWVSRVGSQTYGNPVVADGNVYIGTNNAAAYLSRYPSEVDLGCLICFRETDGEFLWQHSSEKLSTGRVHDWPLQGICCAPLVDGNRLWFVSSRGHVVCLDTEGYADGEDDGPVQNETARLFKESPTLNNRLDDGYLSDVLRAIFHMHGLNLNGRVRVQAREAGARWLLTVKKKDNTAYYEIQLNDKLIDVYRLESDEQEELGEKILTVESQLDAGLDEGRMSDGFRAICHARDFAFDQDPQVSVEEPGKRWKATVEVNGISRTLEIRRQGPSLIAEKQITPNDLHEADTVWVYDMMSQLQVSQHNMCSCSVTALGDILFVHTSNGVDETHKNIPSIHAPSFMAMNKHTGEVHWTDDSPGENILHGQWSSPTVGTLGGIPQVIFCGGDGWIYSFRADKGQDGKPTLLWKFDANPKTSEWILGGRGTRNNIIATPVIYNGLLYAAVGQDPEHGEGVGHLWCIDPTKRGDVSPELAVHVDNRDTPIPHRRLQAVNEEQGEIAVDNPNSAVIWHFDGHDQNDDGELEFHEEMHRSCGTVAIQDNILFIADFSGIFHCLDAQNGNVHWSYDMFAAAWGSPLIVDGKVYIGDEEGDVSVFPLSTDPAVALVEEDGEMRPAIAEIEMDNSVYSTPIVANDVLFIANRTHLFAVSNTPQEKLADNQSGE